MYNSIIPQYITRNRKSIFNNTIIKIGQLRLRNCADDYDQLVKMSNKYTADHFRIVLQHYLGGTVRSPSVRRACFQARIGRRDLQQSTGH
jgi:hypothetical protein